jgi:5'-deoxynucleotidase YfbR-like HD superfamily hydrolase
LCSSIAAGGLVYVARKLPRTLLDHMFRMAATCLLAIATSFTAGLLVASALKWPDWDAIAWRWVR